MANSEKESCTYKEKIYAHGSEVCEAEKCMICNEGHWEDRVELFPPTKEGKPS